MGIAPLQRLTADSTEALSGPADRRPREAGPRSHSRFAPGSDLRAPPPRRRIHPRARRRVAPENPKIYKRKNSINSPALSRRPDAWLATVLNERPRRSRTRASAFRSSIPAGSPRLHVCWTLRSFTRRPRGSEGLGRLSPGCDRALDDKGLLTPRATVSTRLQPRSGWVRGTAPVHGRLRLTACLPPTAGAGGGVLRLLRQRHPATTTETFAAAAQSPWRSRTSR